MFEQWKERELAGIRAQYGKARLVCWVVVAFMGLNMLSTVIWLLDGGGAMEIVVLLFQIGIIALAWNLGNYKKRFVKPLLASVEETLPSQGEREEFARQMEGAEELLCPAMPQGKACPLWLGRDYLYFRLPRKSRILKSGTLHRVRLARESYTVGRGHVRTYYALSLFQEEERPVWQGSFLREEEAYKALETVRAHLPSTVEVEDRVAYGKTEEGRRENRRSELIQLLLAALLVAALVVVAKLLLR